VEQERHGGTDVEVAVQDGRRTVASWHARAGRLTERKRWALRDLAERYRLRPGDLDGSPAALEIGAGTGEATLALAATRPELLVVAAEVHKASLARLLLDLDAAGPSNVRVVAGDGRAVLERPAVTGRLQLLRVFFPDPWPKRRHHGRRLVDPVFVAAAAAALAPGGLLELATDDGAYAAVMAHTVGADGRFDRAAGADRADRPVTYYERRALDAGRRVRDLRYRRTEREGGRWT
jgi:tRNA (guanine-N7-)-methyltransferase